MPGRLKLYYNPHSRAAIARWMLEEVEADYEIVPIDFEAGDNRKPEFLAVNPLGKLPTVVLNDGTVITETPAILAWAADAYPEKRLAPEPGSPQRGAYYRWLFFGGSCFEPSVIEKVMRADAPKLPRGAPGWGEYDEVLDTVEKAVEGRDYLVGERFTAADLYMGAQLWWAGMFKAPRIAESGPIQAYVGKLTERPAFKRAIDI